MSLLAPLFALAGLAVGLPLLFHLIQRRPRGKMTFSSLMFLSPSPPRLTRRSRIENWLLLLLRAAAVILLAVAFARPFIRDYAQMTTQPPARNIVVLVDTSASMQRAGLMEQAREHVQQVVESLQPHDDLALIAFDTQTQIELDFANQSDLPADRRSKTVQDLLPTLVPSSSGTDLGKALVTAADMLTQIRQKEEDQGEATQQVVLISDLQKGAHDAALRSYEWPKNVKLDVRTVVSSKPTNATPSLLRSRAKSADDSQRDDRLRIRVTNSDDATEAQFRLAWVGREGNVLGNREYPVHVPPGTSQVVRVDRPAAAVDQLSLIGDDHSFDNDLYIAEPPRVDRQLLYVGDDLGEDRSSLLFFLRKAPLSNRWQKVEVTRSALDAPLPPLDPKQTPLVVVGSPLPEISVGPLTKFSEQGGRVLVVLGQASDDIEPWQQFVRSISGNDRLTISEATVRDYSLLSSIDFQHPLFEPFSDPQFSDFTGIRFWSHRNVDVGDQSQTRTIARFDDRWPALIELARQQGRLWILTAGWQPQQSRLALSSKFLPLLGKMFDTTGGRPVYASEYYTNDVLTIEPSDTLTQLRHPDATVETITAKGDAVTLDQIGVYQIIQDDVITPVAVNIPSAEGETAPRSIDELEQLGVVVGRFQSSDALAARQRHMQDVDLEQRQKMWKWLLLAALAVLTLEIMLAHRQTTQTSQTLLQPANPAT